MLEAIAGGLIASGALLLVPSLLDPGPAEWMMEVERDRRRRNADVAKWLSTILTLAGAALLLMRSEVIWALPAVAIALLIWYLALAEQTRRTYARKEAFYRHQLDSSAFIALNEAPYVGLGNWNPTDELLAGGLMAKSTLTDEQAHAALATATQRSTWRWVLRHPTGARNQGL